MIARNLFFFILLIALPDIYIYWRYFRHRKMMPWIKIVWWVPCAVMMVLTVILATAKNFMPDNHTLLFVYLLMLGVLVASKAIFAICSMVGWWIRKRTHSKNNWGNLVGGVLMLFILYVTIYSSTAGFSDFRVRRMTVSSPLLPSSFNGYRIVLFSDAHVGSYEGWRAPILRNAIDSINAQDADVIIFAGDLMNVLPDEIVNHQSLLNSLHASDGVVSVLGNHDYAEYVGATPDEKKAQERRVVELQQQLGWQLLNNEHLFVYRGADSIAIAGTENDGMPPFPQHGDVKKAVKGINDGTFTVMVQHDPTAWRRHVLSDTKAQLTLSGHTHGGQFKILGFSPASLKYREYDGMYSEGDRTLIVSTGLGGLVPFRFGVPGEIIVITLQSSHAK